MGAAGDRLIKEYKRAQELLKKAEGGEGEPLARAAEASLEEQITYEIGRLKELAREAGIMV